MIFLLRAGPGMAFVNLLRKTLLICGVGPMPYKDHGQHAEDETER